MKEGAIAFDLFCGAGGASNGLVQAARDVEQPIGELVAVNHWDKAVETHRLNHPWANVLHEDLSRVDPRPLLGGKRVKIGLAGPSCVYHSRARGGKPMGDGLNGKPGGEQERSHAWDVLRWARLVEPENLLVENVPEFKDWGPLKQIGTNPDGSPIYAPDPLRKGEYFREFLQALRRLGYNVDWRVLCAAHYGDATTRRRLFIQARRGTVRWPEPSHRLQNEAPSLFDLPLARSAREIIDWNLPGESIWDRPKPLSEKTMARIMEGLRRFAGVPFIVPQLSGARARSVEEPMNTITATGTGNALCVPFIVPQFGEAKGQAPRVHSIKDPLPSVTSHGAGALVEAFVMVNRTHCNATSLDEPLSTLCTGNHQYLIEPFLVSYYGTGHSHAIGEALPTITGKDRFGLVETYGAMMEQGVAVVADIRLRMLQPHELAAAHSFPDGYQFVGNKSDAVKMVGNSWPVATGTALCRSILEG